MPDYSVFVQDTVQCAFYGDLDGRATLTSVTFRKNGGAPVLADTQLLSNQMADYYILRVLPLLSNEFRFDFAIVVPLNMDFSIIWGSSNPSTHGATANPAMPNNVGFRVELATAGAGRAYRGWNTFSGIPRVVVTKNTVDQTWADNLVGVWVGLGPLANALGWEWVVTSTHVDGGPRAVGITTPITQVYYKDLTVDSIRHRLPGRRF